MTLDVIPQLLGNAGLAPLRAAIAEPRRYAIERKVDGVRGLVVFAPVARWRHATVEANAASGSASNR